MLYKFSHNNDYLKKIKKYCYNYCKIAIIVNVKTPFFSLLHSPMSDIGFPDPHISGPAAGQGSNPYQNSYKKCIEKESLRIFSW